MIFELVSWIYISLACLICGNWILKSLFGIQNIDVIEFPVICFIGMSVFGIITFYLSLLVPLFSVIKWGLQLLALVPLIRSSIRNEILSQLKRCFGHFTMIGFIFLAVSTAMVLVVCSAPVIHPDSLNYHVFSTQIFDLFGAVPGIANLKPEFGFQSMWFAALAFFHFSFSESILIFPLNGCVMIWVVIFLISGASGIKKTLNSPGILTRQVWYLVLILFALLSWTQIRLTASSLSPDFIAAITILLAFYFFSGIRSLQERENSDLIAVFLSAVAVSIKLSAIPVLLITGVIAGFYLARRKFVMVIQVGLLLTLLLTPIVIRNIISTGYPVYPSTFADFFNTDWKIEKTNVLNFQKYITAYARYPVLRSDSVPAYEKSWTDWLPLWWNHLYMVDRALMIVVISGILLNVFFLRKIRFAYSRRLYSGLFIAMIGTGFWFVNAPDPRFGTGFLLPFVYFLYFPFVEYWTGKRVEFIKKAQNATMKIATFLMLIYIGYRAVYFFHPRQLFFPAGIKQVSNAENDCDAKIKKMVLTNTVPLPPLADSCMFFRFRGTTIKQGFMPAPGLLH